MDGSARLRPHAEALQDASWVETLRATVKNGTVKGKVRYDTCTQRVIDIQLTQLLVAAALISVELWTSASAAHSQLLFVGGP